MEQSILFIKIIALYFVVSGAFLLLKGKTLPLILKDFFNHPAIVYLIGVILVLLGGGILIQNNAYVSDKTIQTLTIIFGWLVLIKGLAYIFIPKVLAKIFIKKFNNWFGVLGVVIILIGVYLFFVV